MAEFITIEREESGLVTFWLNRSDVKNALNGELIGEVRDQLRLLSQDDSVRMLVLRGKGTHFCAGADLEWMRASVDQSYDENVEDASQLAQLLALLDSFPAPTVAYVQGGAYGGGVGIMSCCDIVLADPEAIFSFSEVKLGLVPAMISPYILRRMGENYTRRYTLTAEKFNGKLAHKMGLVHELVQPAQVERWIQYFADHFLAAGPQALKETKKLLLQLQSTPPDQVADLTANCLADVRQGEEAQAGMKAFFEKETPPWRERDV